MQNEQVPVTQAEITSDDWNQVDDVLCPFRNPNSAQEWARYTDELRTALAQHLANSRHRLSTQADMERMREALERIAAPIDGEPVGDPWAFYADLQNIARAALNEGKSA